MMTDSLLSIPRTRRDILRFGAASAVGLAFAANTLTKSSDAIGQTNQTAAPQATSPLRSAGVMTFGVDNVLFVGDIKGSAIHAFALREKDFTAQTNVDLGNFHNFEGRDLVKGVDQKLAGMLGTTYDNIQINDLVVHQPTQQIYLSVERGRGADVMPVIVKVNNGNLEILDLENIPHSQITIPNQPDEKAMLEFEPQRVFAITDIKFYKGELFVTGVSNQRLASAVHRIPYPFNAEMATCTAEIWHPVHGEFETRAPIIRQLIREVHGEPYLFAVYGRTPLVRFPLSALKDGAHVRGETIGELGYGSNPLDMLTFTDPFDKKEYLMVTIDTRSTSKIAITDLESAQPLPTGGPIDFGPGGLGRTKHALLLRAEHTAILDPKWAVVAWRHPKATYRLDISTLMLPYFFERKDGMSEMNWPVGPDPFDYRHHRNG